jgi:cytochrome c oxidase cbb3-type subunit III
MNIPARRVSSMVGLRACSLGTTLLVSALLLTGVSSASAQAAKSASPPGPARGKSLFARDCAFCHGRDAAGGESGPDLTRSRLVGRDVRGDKIRAVVHDGRIEKGMPSFAGLTVPQVNDLIAFIRDQTRKLSSKPGGRRGVDVADLQTGNVEQGKAYFNGPGKCSSCHSPTGDLAGIATRREGLELEMQMLYPQNAKAKLTVTTTSGETFTGALTYKDEFHIAMTDSEGWYRSWPIRTVEYQIDSPADAHIEQFDKYTDDDIHNLMAYLQTLR